MKLHTTDKTSGGGLILRTLTSILGPISPPPFALPDMPNGSSGNCQGLENLTADFTLRVV